MNNFIKECFVQGDRLDMPTVYKIETDCFTYDRRFLSGFLLVFCVSALFLQIVIGAGGVIGNFLDLSGRRQFYCASPICFEHHVGLGTLAQFRQ